MPGAPYGYPAGQAGAPATTQPTRGPRSRLGELVRRGTAGTPGRLRVFAALAILVSLAFGLAAAQAFRAEHEALDRAAANAQQLVRVQTIHTELVQADAGATNAFLVGGVEPVTDRKQYTDSLAYASKLVATAAQAQPADGPALAVLNSDLVTYSGLVEQARANNRQGLPIGATYLSTASTGLRSDAIPVLDSLARANQARTEVEFASSARAELWVIIFGILALATLVAIMVWVARRTHRLFNVPLAAATALVLVTAAVAVLVLTSLSGQVRSVQSTSYAVTLAVTRARIAAFDAKSSESLTLINRGSGTAADPMWARLSGTVQEQAATIDGLLRQGTALQDHWTPYVRAHQDIRARDNSGNWNGAVKLATGGASNAAFNGFAQASQNVLDEASLDTSSQLSGSHVWLPLVGILALLLGIGAAALAWWGIALRLEEYR